MTPKQHADLDRLFAILEAAAATGQRCPINKSEPVIDAANFGLLALEGRIRVEISGRNYRQVEILTGPRAGKKTAPNPAKHVVWQIVDEKGARIISAKTKKREAPSLAEIRMAG